MQHPRPKTIRIFLPDGNARSLRIAEITSRTVQAIQVPRSKLKEAGDRKEITDVGVYFLFGDVEGTSKPTTYIGEAEDCFQRLQYHNREKDFWNTVVAVTSKTRQFTKAHARYLEWYCCKRAREVDRFKLTNNTVPSKPYVSEPMKAELLDNIETVRILLSTLGFPVLEAVARSEEREHIYYCSGKTADARGSYVDDGFVVFAGSKATSEVTPSAEGSSIYKQRDSLVEDEILNREENAYVFQEDYLFSSPSAAAGAVLGRHANGWTEWKDEEGRTLDRNERQ